MASRSTETEAMVFCAIMIGTKQRGSRSVITTPGGRRTLPARSRSEATTPEAIVYRVAMENPEAHEFQLELRVPALGDRETVEIAFPAWAPGSYMIRDFVRHVYGLAITDAGGRALPHERLDK